MNKDLYLLIGVPASGKTTYREQISESSSFTVISTDDEIERYANDQSKTYDEVFEERISTATAMSTRQFSEALNRQDSKILIDRTNLTPKSRKQWVQRAKKNGYRVWAIVFRPPATPEQHSEWRRRLRNRPGKTIPNHVLTNMLTTFTLPTPDEGITKIVHVDSW